MCINRERRRGIILVLLAKKQLSLFTLRSIHTAEKGDASYKSSKAAVQGKRIEDNKMSICVTYPRFCPLNFFRDFIIEFNLLKVLQYVRTDLFEGLLKREVAICEEKTVCGMVTLCVELSQTFPCQFRDVQGNS